MVSVDTRSFSQMVQGTIMVLGANFYIINCVGHFGVNFGELLHIIMLNSASVQQDIHFKRNVKKVYLIILTILETVLPMRQRSLRFRLIWIKVHVDISPNEGLHRLAYIALEQEWEKFPFRWAMGWISHVLCYMLEDKGGRFACGGEWSYCVSQLRLHIDYIKVDISRRDKV